MKEIVQYYARCNQTINRLMCETIAAGVPDAFHHPLKGYFFKSLGAILEHHWVSDVNWMQSFLENPGHGLRLLDYVAAVPAYGSSVFSDWQTFIAARQRVDQLILDWSATWTDEDSARTVSRKAKSGELITKPVWKSVIHFFNHQTHHRGQVSNVLDELGVENNYSNMIFLD